MEAYTSNQTLIESSLHDATLRGDAVALLELHCNDPSILHKQHSFSPLHLACKLGHTHFIFKLIDLNPHSTEELDPNDKSSILHLAAKLGRLELVKKFVKEYPTLCFGRDMLGRNPVHVAVVNGQLQVLEELLRTAPTAGRERVGTLIGGDTLLHLCVKFDRRKELVMAVEMIGDKVLLNATNVDGETIFHVAVANKRTEMIEFLLQKEKKIHKNKPNSNGMTAMDFFKGANKEKINHEDRQLKRKLKRKKVLASKELKLERNKEDHLNWLEKQRSNLMVVASLIATMAFQAGITPPGGVWQSSTNIISSPSDDPHVAGQSVLDRIEPTDYKIIVVCNTLGFMLSMSSILLLISLPRNRFCIGLIMVLMFVAVCAMAFSFLFSTSTLTPFTEISNIDQSAPLISIIVWVCLMAIILLAHIIKWTWRFIKLLNRKFCYLGF